MAPGLGLPYHQHLFSARLDMAVDGTRNAVEEVEAVAAADGRGQPLGQRLHRVPHAADPRGRGAARRRPGPRADLAGGQPGVDEPLRPPRRRTPCTPRAAPTLLADDRSVVAGRAAFATKHLWVTAYDADERYPAGDFVNQHAGGAGLPTWTAADRALDEDGRGADVVLWHTFGLTHVPRPEDWPIMPVDYAGFRLMPVGFFDRNPTLDVPPSSNGHCHS